MTREQIAERLFLTSGGWGWPVRWGWTEMPERQKQRWFRLADEVELIISEKEGQTA